MISTDKKNEKKHKHLVGLNEPFVLIVVRLSYVIRRRYPFRIQTCTNVEPGSKMSKHHGSKIYIDWKGGTLFPFPVFENTIYFYFNCI